MKPKYFFQLLFALGLATLSLTVLAEKPPKAPKPHKPAKEILHFFAQEKMVNQGVISNATGRIDIHVNSVSKGKPQDLFVAVQNLDANTTYHLQAIVGDATNFTDVVDFTTDNEGRAKLAFRDKAAGKSPKQPFPPVLNPATSIHQLVVADETNQLLIADLGAPDKFEYFVKRDLSTNNVVALLQIVANSHKAAVRVDASGLDAGADYSLALNGGVVTTATADANGKLKVGWELQNPADILSLQSVALLDTGGNTIVGTTFP